MKRISLIISAFLYFSFLSLPAKAAINLQIGNFRQVNDYYSVDVSLSGAASDSAYYLQAMFTKADSPNYLGFTWGQKGEWVQYVSSPNDAFIVDNFPIIRTNSTQTLLIKPDVDDNGYQGPGDYLLRVKRYTSKGTDKYAENSLTVHIAETTPTPENPSPTSTPTPTQTPSPTPIPTTTPSLSPSVTTTPPSPTETSLPTKKAIATIAVSPTITPSPTDQVTVSPIETPLSLSISESPSSEVKGISTSTSSAISRLLIILGLAIFLPATALYFYFDRVKISP